jgi:tetratricopeptide (TPR) repeat protein
LIAAGPPSLYQRGDPIGDSYRVDRLLGEGGFGVVYLVRGRKGGGPRALKTIRDAWLRDDATRALFRKEAELWIGLGRHPYLVRADFVHEEHGRLFLVMEYVPPDARGLSGLEDRLERDPPDLDQALRYAVQFCHGMEYAYSRGIRCHRDIKPGNILVGPDGAVRITDFGIAGVVAAGVEAPPLARALGMGGTMAGSVFGTPSHMPPEQFVDAASCDERSDIYSFGVVLYQMAAHGALPFRPRVAPGPDAPRRLFEEMRRLHAEASPIAINSPLMPVITRCLEKDRALRYSGFAALRSDLARMLLERTGETVTVPTLEGTRADELCQQGISHASLGRHAEALRCYDEALRLRPNEAVLHSNRGNALSHLGRFEEALTAFGRALAIAPRYDGAFANRAIAHARAGRFGEALRDADHALALNARSAGSWQARGVALAHLRRREEAIAAYDEAIAIDARDPLAFRNKAGNLMELGRLAAAVECFDRALALDPQAPSCWVGKATALAQMGRHEEALPVYDEALRLDGWDAKALYNKGNSLVQLERYEEARACFEQATVLAPESASFWYNRAICELLLAQPQRAEVSLRQHLAKAAPNDELIQEARSLLDGIEAGRTKSMARGVRPPRLGNLRAADDRETGEPTPHQSPGLAAAETSPLHPPPLGPTVADLNDEGDRHFRAGRFAEALASFEHALERDPFGAVALGNRANALFKLGRVDAAIAGHEQALASNPYFLPSWASKAAIEQMSGRRAEALASYLEVVAMAGPDQGEARADAEGKARQLERAGVVAPPRSALSWLGAGARHGAAGRWPEAIDALSVALAEAPHLTEAWLMKAEALRRLEMREQATALLEEGLRQWPEDPQLWHARGVELKNAGAREEAVACYDRALSLEPRHAASWSDRGLALGALKRPEAGIESLEKAIALRPDMAPPWLNKALAEEDADRPEDAAHSYRMFLERAGPEQRMQIEMAKDRLAILEPMLAALRASQA